MALIKQTVMPISESAGRLKGMIEKVINDHLITRTEYNAIMSVANEDNHIDPQEQALLNQLLEMIECKSVKLIP